MGLLTKPKSWLQKKLRGWLEVPNITIEQLKEIESNTNLNEFLVWMEGDDKLLHQFYSTKKNNYFWSESRYSDIKRTHSSLPMSMVDALVNVTGVPEINMEDETANERLQTILELNDFENLIKQEQVPKTLATGWGAFFVNYDEGNIVIDFVDARFVDVLKVNNIVKGVVKKTVYGDYLLKEIRTFEKVEYKLFKDDKEVPLSKCAETKELEDYEIKVGMIPAIPVRFRAGLKDYGRSIYQGKLALFDDFDQTWSRLSDNIRHHSVNTFIGGHLIEEDSRGHKILPDQFGSRITVLRRNQNEFNLSTEQPNIIYDGIIETARQQLIMCLAGILTPTSLGFELTRTPNAEAQREREKVTLITRDDIIDNERTVIKNLCVLLLRFEDWLNSPNGVNIQDYEVTVDFSDYGSPTFNERVAVLLPLFSSLAISPERFVEELWAGALEGEALEQEIEKVKNQQSLTNDEISEEMIRSFTPEGK